MAGLGDILTQKTGAGLFIFFVSILSVFMFWEAFSTLVMENTSPFVVMGIAIIIIGTITLVIGGASLGLYMIILFAAGLISLLYGVIMG